MFGMSEEKSKTKEATMKILAVGGAGCNILKRMPCSEWKRAELIAVNTDIKSQNGLDSVKRLQIGEGVTKGGGTGGSIKLGAKAVQETKQEITDAIKDTDLLVLICGLGGGVGSGATPAIAEIAKEMGIFTIAMVTTPFVFEGTERAKNANAGIEKLKKSTDSMIVFSNEKLLEEKGNLVGSKAFEVVNDVISQCVMGIADILFNDNPASLDINDVKRLMSGENQYINSVTARGENRGIEAVEGAVNNALLHSKLDKAQNVLINVKCGSDMDFQELQRVTATVLKHCPPDVETYLGTQIDDSCGDTLTVTIMASGILK